MRDIKTTNTLLLIIALPVLFYVLKILGFIFIPLIFSMFIALLFLPLMRWLKKKKVHKYISIFIVVLLIGSFLRIIGKLIQLSSREILSNKDSFLQKATLKLDNLMNTLGPLFGIEPSTDGGFLETVLQQDFLIKNFGSTLSFISDTLSMTLMTAFFVVLWLGESINFQKVLNLTLLKQKHASVKIFRKIEKDLIKFIKVKFWVSLFTGIGFGLACHFFDVSFPIFWGLFAFVINFVQMIGSVISVVLLALFAFVELDPTGILLFFILTIIGVQALFGGVLEPVFMGKSFSINIITILVMLMFWGFIWGIPGLIMSIPLTVFIKIILEQFPRTQIIASLISGSVETEIKIKEKV